MNYSELYENKRRGTFDFPIELYYVDKTMPRYQMPFHWHLEYELIYVLKGSFELSIDCKTIVMNKGDCAWIGDGVVHGGIPHDCIYECVVFDLGTFLHDTPVCSRSVCEFLGDENGYSDVFKSGSQQAKLADSILQSMETEAKGYEWTTVGLMWQLMGSLIANSNKIPASKDRAKITRLKNVLTYIRNNYDSAISLDELAEVAGMSAQYLCRAFAAMTGRTPIEYLNYFRIETAGEQLLMTEQTITDIAVSCGFNDMSYFAKTFSRYKSVSPSEYRKRRFST